MAVKLSPLYNDAQLVSSIPASGAQLFIYAAGSSAKVTSYTDITGLTPQANPIILNSRGEPANPIWLTTGQAYKFVFSPSTDTDPPTSPIRTVDNVTGVNDSSLNIDQWVSSNAVPTYVSATQFTLAGDQTSTFIVGRRLKFTITAGTVYGTITSSIFTTLTTVIVALDSGVLDVGLSAVFLGLITPTNSSLPRSLTYGLNLARSSIIMNATTMDLFALNNTIDATGSAVVITAIVNAPQAGARRTLYPIAGTTITNGATFAVDGGVSYVTLAGDAIEFEAVTTSTYKVHITTPIILTSKIQPIASSVATNALTLTINPTVLDVRSATLNNSTVNTRTISTAISLTVPSTATLGTTNNSSARLVILAIDNAGVLEAAVVNQSGGLQLDETNLITTIALSPGSTASNVIYSTTARTSVPYRVVGYVDIVETTAGTWASDATAKQGAGGQSIAGFSSIGVGQTWQSFTVGTQRIGGTTYTNNSGKPISVSVTSIATTSNLNLSFLINSVNINTSATLSSGTGVVYVGGIVPNGSTYSVTINVGSIGSWLELR